MVQKVRVSYVLAFPDDMHAEDVISQAQGAVNRNDTVTDIIITPVSSKLAFDVALRRIRRLLVEAGFRDMGRVQTMPGLDEDIRRFFRNRRELVDIVSSSDPENTVIKALLEEEDDPETENTGVTKEEDIAAFLTIAVKTLLLPESMEKLEDRLRDFLIDEGIRAVIESNLTGNTIVCEGVA